MAARGRDGAGLVALRNFADYGIDPRSDGCMAVPGARLTCQSGQTLPQDMAAAFDGKVSSPAPRWQLRPSLTFDYEHGDRSRITTRRHPWAGMHTHAGSAGSFGTSVTDVRHLASAKALKQLDLSDTKVTTEGTMGLECIPTLETLLLSDAGHGRAASGIGEGIEAARPSLLRR
jgi:hypothetical protein